VPRQRRMRVQEHPHLIPLPRQGEEENAGAINRRPYIMYMVGNPYSIVGTKKSKWMSPSSSDLRTAIFWFDLMYILNIFPSRLG